MSAPPPAALSQLYQIEHPDTDVFCARFSPPAGGPAEPQLIALGLGDGRVVIHHAETGRLLQTVAPAGAAGVAVPAPAAGGLPITCLRWRPAAAARAFRVSDATTASRNVLLAAGSDGSLRHIHATSGRVLHTIIEADTQLYACDYRRDGGAFASAGNARVVRVYDEERRALVATLSGGTSVASTALYGSNFAAPGGAARGGAAAPLATGHTNRIFGLAWHPTDDNILASGGWDNTVQIWDLR